MKYLAAAVVAAGCMSPVMHFGAGKSAHEAQHDTLGEFLPPQLDMSPRWTSAPRTAKIRVYADDEFRAQNLKWQQAFGEQLDYANAVLEPVLGLHLDAEYREWDYHAPGATLADDLAALAQRDPGDDVMSVIGLTSSLSLVTATFEELGYANMPGKHVMLRGYADLQERETFARAFPDLSADERDAALEARRRHKTTVVLLHELAHNLGADHDPDPDTIMNATYSDHAVAFSDRARDAMLQTIDERLHPQASPPPAALPAPRELHHQLTIQLRDDGTVPDTASLDDRLRDAASHDPDTEVVIQAGKHAPYAAVVKLIDRARAAGLHQIGLEARP
ncbi:MAG TPA: biopolymer transporter ExbD [Kofleriaceae bacterium]|jgi:hypothetical protein